MPELPEMETYRRLLLPLIVYRPIASVEIQRERSINIPVEQFRAKRTLLKPALVEQSRVYDREGEPCPRCGQPINLATLRSRKTYYCRNCQR
ncbi:hypothetical protein PRECH8_15700 [Insulibacter thermoxylanivorax]|uniref:Formamidopyrimidine-DNA glycosylase n=1 Tax=Insulibacter thermoxylanivorax TaxID=2749268 RepID=A0A916QG40_9BACL|nr:DNA-formamidopyrimidine glycosylase family protein [Insulibacter thermoxylanivorax]GFR38274.1 hypothetical protein PRECH8_15700 [Insulibacter thermoxylanivorax]